MSPPSSITSPPSSITEQASVSPARQSRKKRLSREEEETAEHNEFLPLPTPKESAAFLSQNCSMLLATFSFALIWFAQIAKGACHVHAKGVAEVRVSTPSNLDLSPSTSAVSHLERSKTAGRFLATGHLGLALNEESRALRSPSAARSPQRTNAAGRFLATGHMGILLDTPEDAPASRPAAAAWDPERSNAAGRFLAMGHMGLAMNEDVSAVPPPAGAAPGVHERSDAGLFLATGIFGLVFSQEPYSVLNMRTSEALVSLSPAEENGFVMTCALVHTLIVCVGIAIGNDTLSDIHALTELLQTVAALFVLFCAALWWSWEYKVGPVPPMAELLFASEASYIFGGAASLCAWLVASMVLPHTGTFGRMYTSSRALHHLIAILGVGLYLLDMPTFGVAACFGTFLARMPGAKVAARSSTIAAATTSL